MNGSLVPLFLGVCFSACFAEYFTATIRNPHTWQAYFRNAIAFLRWCESKVVRTLKAVKPMLVAGYVEQLQTTHSRPSVKQQRATIRMLFDWLVTGQVMDSNPARSVRGPRHVVTQGKTPVLDAEETRSLLDSIPTGRKPARDQFAQGKEMLPTKNPEMLRKEVGMHLLAYNLIRGVTAEAASGRDVPPLELSLSGARQTGRAFAETHLAGASIPR